MYIKVNENNEITDLFYNISNLNNDYPHVSFSSKLTSEQLVPYGIIQVKETQPPMLKIHQISNITNPILIDGVWTQNWLVLDISLDEAKIKYKNRVKQRREDDEMAGFTYNGKEYDSDLKSIIRISNAAQVAVTNPNFSVFWTAKDNTESLLTGAELIELQAALVAHISVIHINSRSLKQQIDSATTLAELELIGV